MSVNEFFDHLEAVTIYEDLSKAAHKDHEEDMKRNNRGGR